MKVAVIGATGYTGLELLRIITRHPQVEITCVTSETYQGQTFSQVFPAFRGIADLPLEAMDPERIAKNAQLAFLCLPHGSSMKVAPTLLEAGLRVIDLSGDFRFKDPRVYKDWYGLEHSAPHLLEEAVFGLPELFAPAIAQARLLANPGCYVTSVILALAPLLKAKWIEPSPIYADCKSGVTGGGRKLKQRFHFPECNESFTAYSVARHRHQPEMEEALENFSGVKPHILFSPHLVPMNRGILSTVYTQIREDILPSFTPEMVHELFLTFYQPYPFVRVLPIGEMPNTHNVRGSNFCDIGLVWDKRTGTLVVISALDNLVKGASGQAVQNMNIMAGFPQTLSLMVPGEVV